MSNVSFVSRSIWNEHPTLYSMFKKAFSTTITPLFVLANYCILRKSPKKFKTLKWFLYFHFICSSIEWICNWLLIDIFEFEPSVFLRIDGILKYIIDSAVLFQVACVVESLSTVSALFLFCNRLLLICNLCRQSKSIIRQFLEVLLYILAFFFCTWSLPFTILNIPQDQNATKLLIMTTLRDEVLYPDCIREVYCVVVSDPHIGNEVFVAGIEICSWIATGLAIMLSAKISYWLLERRTKNKMSIATRRMHKKFSQRTIQQVTVYVLFAVFPFIYTYLTIIIDVRIQAFTFFMHFIYENHPTACIISLFLFYDPYRNYLRNVFINSRNNDKSRASPVNPHS